MSVLAAAPAGLHLQGEFYQADFFDNSGGVNLSDSPFRVKDGQHIAGYNIDLSFNGSFGKRSGHTQLNTSPDAALRTFAIGVFTTAASAKTVVRCADTKFQTVNTTSWACTNLTDDTAGAGTTFFNAGSTVPVQLVQFNTTLANTLWAAGGGASSIYGYNGTNVTANGSVSPGGSFATSVQTHNSGSWTSAGTYYYAIALRKAGTQAISNAALDISATTVNTDDTVTLNFASVTGIDTTKYDKIYVYRSSVGGASAFTAGNLAAILASNTASWVDKGDKGNPDNTLSVNVPRANNTNLDNSTLPSGTYTALCTFKRRLVTTANSTIYLSDLNKPESWPTSNYITIPSGGAITAVANIYYSTPSTSATDEILVIFKERECWVLTGSSSSDWMLKFVDSVGCLSQPSIVWANSFICWPDYRGFYIWDGTGKPIYISRPIETQFDANGTLTRNLLTECVGTFFRKDGYVIWCVSDNILGEQKYQLKLNLRLTLPQVDSTAVGRFMDACFIQDKTNFPIFAAASCLPTYDEVILAGDNAGYIYSLYANGSGDPDSTWNFNYRTRPLELGSLLTTKRVHKIIAWTKETSTDNLTLNYWTHYRATNSNEQTKSQPIATSVTASLWDEAFWDVAYWDYPQLTYNPVVFNMPEGAEGEAISLEFVNNNANTQLVICGFSIIYSIAGMRL